ncbi:MAG: hypothetical protein AAFX00_06995 [Pseudomonadota bacterium]
MSFGDAHLNLDCAGLDPSKDGDADRAFLCLEDYQQRLEKLEDQIAKLIDANTGEPFPAADHAPRPHGNEAHSVAYLTTAPEGVPSGAVIAFTSSCPKDGWSEFEDARGRVIIGTNPSRTHGYEARAHESTGGAEKVTLSVEQMPAHSHSIQRAGADTAVNGVTIGTNWGVRSTIGPDVTNTTGGNQPHENMPPYIALYWCKKD